MEILRDDTSKRPRMALQHLRVREPTYMGTLSTLKMPSTAVGRFSKYLMPTNSIVT